MIEKYIHNLNKKSAGSKAFLFLVYTHKEFRNDLYNSVSQATRHPECFPPENKTPISDEEKKLFIKNMKLQELKLKYNLLDRWGFYPIPERSYLPGKSLLPLEEFKKTYFTQTSKTRQEKSRMALNDLLYEIPFDQIHSDDFENKVKFCIKQEYSFFERIKLYLPFL